MRLIEKPLERDRFQVIRRDLARGVVPLCFGQPRQRLIYESTLTLTAFFSSSPSPAIKRPGLQSIATSCQAV